MKNLEQIRAANAWDYATSGQNTRGTQGGEVVKKLPALIMSNGLLAAGAFAYAKGYQDGWYICFNYLAKHLAHPEVAVVPGEKNDLVRIMDFLTKEADSATLKQATDEALAWLCYARRFVTKPRNGGEDDTNE